ncbi:UDP-N-acetylglucosamine 2-epimerase (non-hydrolysing) [Geoalkalibacter ferrihydriticus]|uniref:UDP-N-acetylglucosamine 2-epimerase n=2 Tax=Geoalkalibacter ferrihydriticus TaxID=392333 RepID=A0A0C2HRL1_9BACT|nr:UDP-N-acetylglucosamine 2-epimerase (non-hydrolyzing) [Geoalkalibacter ferrihydriticus]KIH75417.1 UDP-N-acetylglucosamine 2-epimerase [Geoalkalibacter ferrihydriticus DSM 17813]SDM92213.1 UDP-N-acetylglucosamine 2-epimerase (non-hydrolysing) [Geoalkalibacter ferrihydriticus]
MTKTIDLIAGARPNFMKISPIIDALKLAEASGGQLRYRLIHTGQHYDHAMSGGFFEQLGIPAPDVNLEVGSGTQAEQTAAIMVRYEKLLLEQRSDLCLVVGDVTSTMACSIAARKLGVPVAHVEGGIRSGDWAMPEEINRVVTDSITNWFFTTSATAGDNLRRSGVADENIFFVGNTMIDTLMKQMPRFRLPEFWQELDLESGNYFVVTLHRPANVDGEHHLLRLLQAISKGTAGLPIIFPVHPRTAKNLQNLAGQIPNIHYVDPQGYLEFNYLVKHAKGVITDSGGITEETTVMGIPCLTLRDNTERPETVTIGTNELIGTDPANLAPALARLMAGQWKKGGIPETWDGRAAERIVGHLENLL